jgi:hypothetical protein
MAHPQIVGVDDQELGAGRMSKKLCNASHGRRTTIHEPVPSLPKESGVEVASAWPKGHITDVQPDEESALPFMKIPELEKF